MSLVNYLLVVLRCYVIGDLQFAVNNGYCIVLLDVVLFMCKGIICQTKCSEQSYEYVLLCFRRYEFIFEGVVALAYQSSGCKV